MNKEKIESEVEEFIDRYIRDVVPAESKVFKF